MPISKGLLQHHQFFSNNKRTSCDPLYPLYKRPLITDCGSGVGQRLLCCRAPSTTRRKWGWEGQCLVRRNHSTADSVKRRVGWFTHTQTGESVGRERFQPRNFSWLHEASFTQEKSTRHPCHRIIELFELEGTSKSHLVQLPYKEQGHLQLHQAARPRSFGSAD